MTDSAPMKTYRGNTVKGYEAGGGGKSFSGVMKSLARSMLAKKRAVKFKKSYSQTPSMGDGGGGVGG